MISLFRVRRLSIIDCGVLFALVNGAAYLVLTLLVVFEVVELYAAPSFGGFVKGALAVTMGGFTGGSLLALVFNAWSHWSNGFRIELEQIPSAIVDEPESNVEPDYVDLLKPNEGTSESKACPACDARVRADRTFCPECGHDFE